MNTQTQEQLEIPFPLRKKRGWLQEWTENIIIELQFLLSTSISKLQNYSEGSQTASVVQGWQTVRGSLPGDFYCFKCWKKKMFCQQRWRELEVGNSEM